MVVYCYRRRAAMRLLMFMNRISRCSSWPLGQLFGLCSGPLCLCLRLAGAVQKLSGNPPAGRWRSSVGVPLRISLLASVETLESPKVVTAQKVACLCALGVHRARHAAAAIQQRPTNCKFTNYRRRCSETELPPTRPLQLAADACRRARPARLTALAPTPPRARRALRWRARAATPSSSRPTTV